MPRVILVEDNADDEFFFLRTWDKAGLRGNVQALRDGNELVTGLEALRSGSAEIPCLVFLDSVIQPLSTEEICGAIESLGTNIPIILLSGAEDSPLERRLEKGRLVRVLRKPITVATLRESVLQHCPNLDSGLTP